MERKRERGRGLKKGRNKEKWRKEGKGGLRRGKEKLVKENKGKEDETSFGGGGKRS